MNAEIVKLSDVISHQKKFIVIDDNTEYKRCRVQLHRQGIIIRDIIKGSEINTKKQQVCKAGQLLVAEIDAKVGGYGIVPPELDGAIVSSHYYLYDVNQDKLSLSYLKYYLKTDDFFNQIKPQGSTNYAAIRPRDVLNISIHLPSLEVQNNIANKLQVVHDNIKLCNAKIESNFQNMFALRQSILQEAIQGKLVPQDLNDEPASVLLERIRADKEQLIKEKKIKKEKPLPEITEDEIPYALPTGWEWARLVSISIKLGAGSTPTGGKKVYTDNGIMFIRSQNVWNDGLKVADIAYISDGINNKMQGSIVKANDILLNITGASIGRSCVLDKDFDTANVNQHVSIIRLVDPEMNAFIHKCIISPYIQKLIMDVQVGVSREGLSMDKLGRFLIPIPPQNEQTRIKEKIDQLMVLCDELEKNVDQSKRDSEMLMQSVIQEAFSQSEKEDNVVEFTSANSNDIEDWEIAARSDGEINSVTKVKIKNRVTELLGKSQQ